MIRTAARLTLGILMLAAALPAKGEELCGQNIDITFAGNDPREGIYMGIIGAGRCAGIAIESFGSKGTASIVYFLGKWQQYGPQVWRREATLDSSGKLTFGVDSAFYIDLDADTLKLRRVTTKGESSDTILRKGRVVKNYDLCGQQIALRLAGKDPREGIYSGVLDLVGGTACGGIVIEEISLEGTATVLWFYGKWQNHNAATERYTAAPGSNYQFNFAAPYATYYFNIEGRSINVRRYWKGSAFAQRFTFTKTP